MPEIRITSLDDPRLDPFRSLKKQNAVRNQHLFIAEGPTVVDRVLQSGVDVRSVLISDRKYDGFRSRLRSDIPVYRLTHELARTLVGFSFHCGVVACAQRPQPPDVARILSGDDACLVLAGDRIVDPENVGSLIRVASAFGAALVVLGPGCADPYSRRVIRVSMANVLFQPVLETLDLVTSLQHLRTDFRLTTSATVLSDTATSAETFRFPHRSLLLFGNEYDGVTPEGLSMVQHRVSIEMRNNTDSLNVAVAAGIFAWAYRRQHGAMVEDTTGCDETGDVSNEARLVRGEQEEHG